MFGIRWIVLEHCGQFGDWLWFRKEIALEAMTSHAFQYVYVFLIFNTFGNHHHFVYFANGYDVVELFDKIFLYELGCRDIDSEKYRSSQ